MPITRLESEKGFLDNLKKRAFLQRYSAEMVIEQFNLIRRKEQIAFAQEGHDALWQYIGSGEKERLEFWCYFDNVKGDMKLLGILASYVERGKGILLWWEPEKGE